MALTPLPSKPVEGLEAARAAAFSASAEARMPWTSSPRSRRTNLPLVEVPQVEESTVSTPLDLAMVLLLALSWAE